MIDIPVAFAFTAGLVATVNPCGFAMLPAYLSYFMGAESDAPGGVGRALVIGGVVSAGFLLVFGVTGVLVTLGLRSVVDLIPWAALAVGVLLVVLGAAMSFFGYEPQVGLPKVGRGGRSRSSGSMFLFGVSYAVASLSCALPVFLAVVATATATTNFVSGVLTFVVYGVGMSMLLVVLTLALALARDGVVRRVRALMPYVGRVAGAVLMLAGAYITAYWMVNLRDPLAARGAGFRWLEQIQGWLADQLGTRPGFWAVVFGVVIAAALVWAFFRSRPGAGPPDVEFSGSADGVVETGFRSRRMG